MKESDIIVEHLPSLRYKLKLEMLRLEANIKLCKESKSGITTSDPIAYRQQCFNIQKKIDELIAKLDECRIICSWLPSWTAPQQKGE